MKFYKLLVQQNLICLAFFIFILLFCMLQYPGGSRFDNEATHYLFFENFISHLGKQTTSSGLDNSFGAFLFKIGIYVISFSFAILFLGQPPLFKNHVISYRFSILSSTLALCSALAFIGIGYYSADPSTIYIHLMFVKISFYLFFISSISQTVALKLNPFFPKKHFLCYLIFSIVLLLYNLLIEFGPKPNSDLFSLVLQVSGQKTIAVFFFFNFIFQGIGILSLLKSQRAWQPPSS